MTVPTADEAVLRRAMELAARGRGFVEPNPQVAAVITAAGDQGRIIGEGWHEHFGGPHAEVVALSAAGPAARGGTLFVTLEPCCHHGKTPPCTDAILAAGIARVVVAATDPFPEVAGRGIEALRRAGVVVETGLCEAEAIRLTAPFRKLVTRGQPWVIAKWAMSLDGRVAAAAGQDRWISSPESRALVHDLRSRIDAIAIGIGTALADDPLLTVRTAGAAGPRQPLRIVFDSLARLPLTSALVRTARETPVLVAVGPAAASDRIAALAAAGVEIWRDEDSDRAVRLGNLLHELGRRRLTNLLVEGGPDLLGSFFAAGAVDEVWAFIAPKILGGAAAGAAAILDVPSLRIEEVAHPGGDIFIRGILPAKHPTPHGVGLVPPA
ncbi:MAG: bifunctional diaminohydroxyphosphoribosylaminopyrimidine deaminase/5-amino-6-(5-phosphoribosylamino)uracil reductase RibD [Pirellulales bacterium]